MLFAAETRTWRPSNPFQLSLMEAVAATEGVDVFHGAAPFYWRSMDFDVVHFQWPEAIFAWRAPSKEELRVFQDTLRARKKHSRIVTTVHNAEAHEAFGDIGDELLEEVYSATDTFVHLTEYSRVALLDKRPRQNHVVIPHGDYSYYRRLPRDETALTKARHGSNPRLLLVFGALRTVAEEELARESFYKASPDNTTLVFAGAPSAAVLPRGVPQAWKKRRDKDIVRIHARIPDEQVQSLVEGSKFLFLPRNGRLNSGVISLALTFGRPVIAPDDAISADLAELDLPRYAPGDVRSAARAIDEAFSMSDAQYRAMRTRIARFRDVVMNWATIARAYRDVYGMPPKSSSAGLRPWIGGLFGRRQ